MGEKQIEKKKQIVLEIKDMIERSQGVIFYDYRGLTVDEVTELRNKFREADVEYHVLKNAMLRRAVDMLKIEGLNETLIGPTAVAFGYSDAVAPAKVLVDFVKKIKKTEIKAGVLGNQVIDIKSIQSLAALPTKDELLATLAGTLQAPISGFARSLSGIICKLGYALNAVNEQKQA